MCPPQSQVYDRDLHYGKDAGSGRERDRERDRGRAALVGKKLSLVNLITLVTVRLGQTQQPNTLHLKHKQCTPQQSTHKHTQEPAITSVHKQHRVRQQQHI